MDLYVLIFGLILCAFSVGMFLYVRLNKGGIAGLLTKTFASLCYVVFALLLFSTKSGVAFYGSLPLSFLIIGLVCGLIGDILLDLKVIYPFHEDKYLVAGMSSFGLGHIFYILAVSFFIGGETTLFAPEVLYPILIIFGAAVVLTLFVWLVSVKFVKLNYSKFTFIINIYTFILLFVTALTGYFCFVVKNIPLYIPAISFVFFLASDLILSVQYFGKKQDNKSLVFANHLTYYIAQILIAMFVFFV